MEILDIIYQLIGIVIIPLITALLASSLTYFLGIKKFKEESILSKQIDIYASLMEYVRNLPDRTQDTSHENLTSLASEFNEIYNKIYLFSPDHIVRDIRSTMEKSKKGTTYDNLWDLMLTLRKEYIPKTTLKPDDFKFIIFTR